MSGYNPESLIIVEAKRILFEAEAAVLENSAVLVDGETILAVDTPDKLMNMSDRSIPRIRLGDLTLLPGMIDCHVHLGYEEAQDRRSLMEGSTQQALLTALMLYNARKLLRAGVTTIRELGSSGQLGSTVRAVISKGWSPGPRVLAANEPLTTTGGHAWFLGGECDSVEEIRKAVRNRHKSGADLVKIMVTGGGLTSGSVPWRAQFSQQEVDTAVEEASRLGMPVAAHVHGTEGIAIAVNSGVTTIEHCTWMGEGGRIGNHIDTDVLQEIVDRGIFVCPTASSRWGTMDSERRDSKIRTVAIMHEAGVRLIAGTDAGIEHVPYDSYAQGLSWLQRCGMSTLDVLAAATSNAAESCGIANITGTIAVGKSADMIAVTGDPRVDLEVLSKPVWVMARGKQVLDHNLVIFRPQL